MQLMKSAICAAFGFVLLFAIVAGAQTKTMQATQATQATQTMQNWMPDSMQVEHHVEMLKDSLSLTDDQTAKIHTIYMNEQQQLMAGHEKYSSDNKAFRKVRNDLRTSTDKQVKDVLTKDQWTKYEQFQKDMHKNNVGARIHKMDHGSTPDNNNMHK